MSIRGTIFQTVHGLSGKIKSKKRVFDPNFYQKIYSGIVSPISGIIWVSPGPGNSEKYPWHCQDTNFKERVSQKFMGYQRITLLSSKTVYSIAVTKNKPEKNFFFYTSLRLLLYAAQWSTHRGIMDSSPLSLENNILLSFVQTQQFSVVNLLFQGKTN